MAEWKKILTTGLVPDDIKTGGSVGKTLKIDPSSASNLVWGDDVGIDRVATAPTTSGDFPKGPGTFVLHSNGAINDVYFLAYDEQGIYKIDPGDPAIELNFQILTFFDSPALDYRIKILKSDQVWKAPGALDFAASYLNDATVTGNVKDQSNTTITADITAGGNTKTSFDNDNNIMYPTNPGDSKTFTLSATSGGTTVTKSNSITFFENVVYSGSTSTSSISSATIRGTDFTEEVHGIGSFSAGASGTFTVGAGEHLCWAQPTRFNNIGDSHTDVYLILAGKTSDLNGGPNGMVMCGWDSGHNGKLLTDHNNVGDATGHEEHYEVFRTHSSADIPTGTVHWKLAKNSSQGTFYNANYTYIGFTDTSSSGSWDSNRVKGITAGTSTTVNYVTDSVNHGTARYWPDANGDGSVSYITTTETSPYIYFAFPTRLISAGQSVLFKDPDAMNGLVSMVKKDDSLMVRNEFGYEEAYTLYISEFTVWASDDATIRFFTEVV